MKTSTQFDAGPVVVKDSSNSADIRLAPRPDDASEFAQWLYFRLQGAVYQNCVMHFENAVDAAYPLGWEDYQACASYDRQNRFRMPISYENGMLTTNRTPLSNSVYYAYFESYSNEQHLNLSGDAQGSGLCHIDGLGSTVQGRDINLLTIGNQVESDMKVWVIARQHPGETVAEWFVEGLLGRLLDPQDPIACMLFDRATFYTMSNMNSDGLVLGNLRTNAVGVNLNRERGSPVLERSPEVSTAREKMMETGVDLFLDIHDDEGLSFVFVVGTEGVPNYNERIEASEGQLKLALLNASPDFQDDYGYDKDAPGQANIILTTNWVGNHFNCLAYTLEMSFKDNVNLPDDDSGWNGQCSLCSGEVMLSAILDMVGDLR